MTRARRMAWEVTVRDIETGRVVLRRLCGTHAAARMQALELSAEVDRDHYAVEHSVTKAALERAIKAKVPRGKGAKARRELMEDLDSVGAVRESVYTTFAETKAMAEEAAQ